MSNTLDLLKALLGPDEVAKTTDEELSALLILAGDKILRKRYPFGVPEGAEVPLQYSILQAEVAVYLYNKKGAEDQVSHSEPGVSRTWVDIDTKLRDVVPMCASVFVQ